jgi:hypothetical protein
MPKLTDPDTLLAIKNAFELNRRFSGYVTWKQQATENVRRLPGNFTPARIDDLVWEHLRNEGDVRVVNETRQEHLDSGFHYDIVVPVAAKINVYVETVLGRADPDDPLVRIVNCHLTD